MRVVKDNKQIKSSRKFRSCERRKKKTVLKYETDYAGSTKIVDVLTSNKKPLNSLHLNVTHRAKML